MPQDTIPYDSIPVPTANPVNSVLSALKAARPVVCGVYRNYPGFFTTEVSTELPGVQQLGAKTAMDSYCGADPGGLPPQPSSNPPFTGGQCKKDYVFQVKYRFDQVDSSGNRTTFDSQTGPTEAYGPLVPHYGKDYGGIEARNADGTPLPVAAVIKEPNYSYSNESYSVINLRTADGSPDNCGDLPQPGYPPSTPPPGDVNVTVPVPDPAGGPTYNTSVSIYGKIGAGVYVDIGPFRFDFGPTGVGVDAAPLPPDPTKPPSPSNPPPPPAAPSPTPPPPAGSGPGDRPPPSPDNHKVTPQPPSPGAKRSGLPGLAYVKLDTTVGYKNVEIQSGSSPPDVVYHVGWFWFSVGDHMCERQYVDTYAKIFTAPVGADGYVYALLPGSTAIATEYTPKT